MDSAGIVLPFADAVGRNWVVNAFYTYPGATGGYANHDTLLAWNGYWFLALEPNLSLIFPKVLAGSIIGNPPLPQPETEWIVNIQAQSGDAVDHISAFGASNLATAGFDAAFDQPESPKPPIPNAISVYFQHPEWNLVVDRFNSDMQALLEPGETREWEFTMDGLGDITLSWADISVEDHQFTLVDVQKGQSIDMRQQHAYTYNTSYGLRAFRVIVHHSPTTGILNNGIAPDVFSLSQNYPNPFNPSTEIQFQVPQVSQVTITLFNLLGQKVRTLVNSQMEPGSYKTVWDGRNDFGQKVASGIYIYRMNAGEFSSVKKMILMK